MAGLLIGEELDEVPILLADAERLELGGGEALQTVIEAKLASEPGATHRNAQVELDPLLIQRQVLRAVSGSRGRARRTIDWKSKDVVRAL